MTVWESVRVIIEWLNLKELNIDVTSGGLVCASARNNAAEVTLTFSRKGGAILGFSAFIQCSLARYEFNGPNADWGFCGFGSRIRDIKGLGKVMEVHAGVIERKTEQLESIQSIIDTHMNAYDEAHTLRTTHIACLNNFAV